MNQVKFYDNWVNEDEINKFLKENNYQLISISFHNLHDNYSDGSICNQCVRTVLIYNTKNRRIKKWLNYTKWKCIY